MALSSKVLALAEDFLKDVRGELQPWTSNKIELTVGRKRTSLEIPSHIQFARYGRKAGKQPPVSAILEWVKKEGIATDPKEQLGTAFAIAKSIGKNGTRNYIAGAPDFVEEVIKKFEDDFIEDVVSVTSDDVAEQVIDRLKKVFGSSNIEVEIK